MDLSKVSATHRLYSTIIQTLGSPEERPSAADVYAVLTISLEHADAFSIHSADTASQSTEIRELKSMLRERDIELEALRNEKKSALIEKQRAVARLEDSLTSKEGELTRMNRHLEQVDASPSTRLRWLSEVWQQLSPRVGASSKRDVAVGWKYSQCDMPAPGRVVAAALDDRLLLGSRGNGELYLFDLKSNKCRFDRTRTFPKQDMAFDGLSVYRDQIYANLYDDENSQLELYTYNMRQNNWHRLCTKPAPAMSCSSMVVAENTVFIVGGRDTDPPHLRHRTVCTYSLSTREWLTLPTSIAMTARSCASCVLVDKQLFIGGGMTVHTR